MNTRIKSLRKYLGMNQTEFGARLGVKQTTVAGWESGGRVPLESILTLICKEFNVNETWLRTGEGEMLVPEDRENALMQWVAEVLADRPESFRRRYLNLLRNLTYEDWQRMEAFAQLLIDNRDP